MTYAGFIITASVPCAVGYVLLTRLDVWTPQRKPAIIALIGTMACVGLVVTGAFFLPATEIELAIRLTFIAAIAGASAGMMAIGVAISLWLIDRSEIGALNELLARSDPAQLGRRRPFIWVIPLLVPKDSQLVRDE